jgi:nicotine blue oxidoreductase
VVLAAGRSTRMGAPKALLPVEGESFLARAVATLREGGCDPVVAVVPPGAPGLVLEAEGAGARTAVNPDPAAQQVDSLRVGLTALPASAAAAVVLPVDFPHASPSVVKALIGAFRARGARIVRPVHGAAPGHPVLFARELWAELSDPGLEEGARDVVHRHRDEIEDVPVDDRGVIVDVDTPADFEREVGEP